MAWAALRPVVKACIGGSLIGITISDRYFSFATVHGGSMRPTFDGSTGGREYALVKRSPLYDYARGEVVVFVSPTDHRSQTIKRLIGLPGDWISVPEKEEIRKIPEDHCWVEGDNGSVSRDSRDYGPVPLGLVQGRVTARGVATRQDGPRRQEGASGRKGHAGAKSLVHLSSLLGCFVPQFCSFLQDINVTMRQEEDIALLRIANVAQLLVSRLDPL